MSVQLIVLIVLFEYIIVEKGQYFFDSSHEVVDYGLIDAECNSHLLSFAFGVFCCTEWTKVCKCRGPPFINLI